MGKETHRHAMEGALHFKMIMEVNAEPTSRKLWQNCQKGWQCKLSSIVKIYLYVGITMILNVADGGSNLRNLHVLLQFRIDAGDKVLEEVAGKNCTHRSKNIQNEVIDVWKKHNVLPFQLVHRTRDSHKVYTHGHTCTCHVVAVWGSPRLMI